LLKLKRVDIQGFKSFYDRTEMRFHGSGIAAVVGPNGCGKSNLSDAISWVLGEQSAKSLRGARMEDVIFAGTRERKPLGMAQVTLTMSDPAAKVAATQAEKNESAMVVLNGIHGTNGGTNGLANGHHANGHASPDNVKPATGHASGLGHHAHGHTGEVTITRRLYRSGESEYLIDGRSARLRDIQDLFSGTGLGPESYAIIEQGRIGQILSNKPADRRAIIEEAAGVGKYKSRKRLAEAKLEGAKQNLSRVFDILEEVGRQVNSLKRQASKAKRYEELRTEMLGYLRRAVSGRFQLLEREAAKLALDLGQAQTTFQNLSAEVQANEQEHARTQESCYQVEAALTASRARVAELNLETERTRGRLESQARQIGAIEERLAGSEAEIQNLDARHERESADLTACTESLAAMERDYAEARSGLETKAAERDALQARLREQERLLETARQQVLRLMGEASSLRNQLAQTDEYLASMERDAARARKEEETALGELARLEQVKAEISTRLSAGQLEMESLSERRQRVEEELKGRQQRVSYARSMLQTLRDSLSKERARKESLEGILSHRAYTTESVKHLFTEIERGHTGGFRPLGLLADFVEVTQPEWEKASEEFLREELEYVVVRNWAEAEQGVAFLRAESGGRATFLVHDTTLVHDATASSLDASGAAPSVSDDPGVAGKLRDAVRLTNGFADASQGFLPRLSRCFLASDRTEAARLAAAHPDCYFLLPDGASYHGDTVTVGGKSASGPLAMKRELREITGRVETHEREANEVTGELESLERAVAQLSQELEQVRTEQQAREKDALALGHEQRKLAEEHARSGARLSTARLELERLTRKDQEAREQRERNHLLVAEKEQARFDQEKALENARGEFEAQQTHAHAIGEEYSTLRAALAVLEERARSEKASAARLEAQVRQIAGRREQLAADAGRMGVERNRLLADNIELDQKAQMLSDHTAEAAAAVEVLTAQETGGRTALAALDEHLRSLRLDAQAAQETRAQVEVELVRKQSDLKHLDETSRKELGEAASMIAAEEEAARGEIAAEGGSPEAGLQERPPEAGLQERPPEAGLQERPPEASVEETEQLYQEVRARIEALGPVNPQALEEFKEAQQRYDFLNAQRQDLIDSIRDTEKAIQELDTESRRRFQEAFEAVNAHFKEMFRTLFGGGQGEMRLTDETNLAESGIDIMASPPGKRLQHVTLLSGGEKSLTAMALLMAVFRYTPSPFCILDEVDAPLDEPNIQRLTRLIKEMAVDTQFIVMTHAKRTMEVAESLYGVTMQEPGISKLVSVKFDSRADAPQPTSPSAAAMAAV
jgi:chromosome segregation protein